MSIADKLSYLNDTKEGLRIAINQLGGRLTKTTPFRNYADGLNYLYSKIPKVEAEGENITFNDVASALMKLDLKGNSSQIGTPTPTSPIPVSVVSGDNDVVVCGKNMLDISKLQTITKNGVTITNNGDGSITLSGTSTGEIALDFKIPVTTLINGNTYTFSKRTTIGGGLYALLFRTPSNQTIPNSVLNTNLDSSDEYKILTCNSNVEIGYMRLYIPNNKVITNHTIYPMLEKGSSMTTFEPYQSQTYEVDLGTLELCKIGTYQDYFTKNSSGQWCKYNAIGKVVLDGSAANFNYTNGVYYTNDPTYMEFIKNQLALSNYFSYGGTCTNTSSAFNNGNNKISLNSNDGLSFYFRNDSLTSKVEWQTWLSTHNTIVYYVLATQYLSLIEDNNLIEQLDNLENAMSYEGQTNISQVNNDKAFIISAKALEDGTNEVVVNNIGNVYSKPLLALEGNGNVDIYLDNTQILRANLEDKMNIDIAQLEAYNPDTMTLLNRQVIGNYNSMTLQPGNNTVRIDGALDKATITNYTRWL